MKMFMGRFACVETFPNQALKRNYDNSFTWDDGEGMFSMNFDENGNYINQTQEGLYGPETFSKDGVKPLTDDQMKEAI